MNNIAHIETVSGESQTEFNNTLALTIERLQHDNLDVEVQFSASTNTYTKPRTSLVQSNTVFSALLIGRVTDESKSVDIENEDIEVIDNAELITK